MNKFLKDKKLLDDIADMVYQSNGKQGFLFARRILKRVHESRIATQEGGQNAQQLQPVICSVSVCDYCELGIREVACCWDSCRGKLFVGRKLQAV